MNKKTRLWAAAAALTFVLAGGGITFRMVQERKATEAADAAQRAKWESAEQAAANQSAAAEQSAPDIQTGRRQVDYAFFATNEYSEQNAFNRQQLFKNKELIYGGKRYLRHTGTRAILLLGLDRRGDGTTVKTMSLRSMSGSRSPRPRPSPDLQPRKWS